MSTPLYPIQKLPNSSNSALHLYLSHFCFYLQLCCSLVQYGWICSRSWRNFTITKVLVRTPYWRSVFLICQLLQHFCLLSPEKWLLCRESETPLLRDFSSACAFKSCSLNLLNAPSVLTFQQRGPFLIPNAWNLWHHEAYETTEPMKLWNLWKYKTFDTMNPMKLWNLWNYGTIDTPKPMKPQNK